VGRNVDPDGDRAGPRDSAEGHLYRLPFCYADSLAYSSPDLDAHAEPDPASHLHRLPDAYAASHHHSSADADSDPHLDVLPHARARHSIAYPDSDAHANSEPDQHPLCNADIHADAYAGIVKSTMFFHML
jgi:hypothetical protein